MVPENFCVFLPNQKAERRRPFGTGLVRHCPQGLFSPLFTFLRAIFFRPFRLSLAPTICPWVSEDGKSCVTPAERIQQDLGTKISNPVSSRMNFFSLSNSLYESFLFGVYQLFFTSGVKVGVGQRQITFLLSIPRF